MWETWVRSLGWDDPLEKGKTTHSSILALRIQWTIYSMGSQRVGHDWMTFTFTFHLVRAMVFPVVMYWCESWTIKKAECRRIHAFELWCWRRLLRVPWLVRRSNQSILKESMLNIHWKDWCWSWNSSTLATWCKLPAHWKRPWSWERLKAGGEGDGRGCDG